ncbi:uncharacterized protein LOC108105745 [Drosophila eugracilis]|uniref:uncharacterized protein LOC108105745 n=1 Tax=Drosophila eugracilis TaxID=29029 RepID=UPI001BDA56D5|nr:uncharacterized protein LOC108105745 [Drosophila eugracilis]
MMKLLIASVALMVIGFTIAEVDEEYNFTSQIFCSIKNGKRECVPCTKYNGVVNCPFIKSGGHSGNNGLESKPNNGFGNQSPITTLRPIRYGSQGNGYIGNQHSFNNNGNNVLVGYSPTKTVNTHNNGRNFNPTQNSIKTIGYNSQGNVNVDDYVDGPDNIPDFD